MMTVFKLAITNQQQQKLFVELQHIYDVMLVHSVEGGSVPAAVFHARVKFCEELIVADVSAKTKWDRRRPVSSA